MTSKNSLASWKATSEALRASAERAAASSATLIVRSASLRACVYVDRRQEDKMTYTQIERGQYLLTATAEA